MSDLLDRYFTHVDKEILASQGFASQRCLRFYLKYLFKGILFNKARVLDIGGGIGLFSFYAACMGADEVICLEPESAGSSPGVVEKFKKLQLCLHLDQVKLESTTIQDFDPKDRKFDIILLQNSINHLDEESCINLQQDSCAIETYKKIFEKLSYLAGNKAKLIITDCSRYNFFALCGLRNPFAPGIKWYTHQSPKCWTKLLSDAGFCNPKVRWTSFCRLGSFGRLLLGNKIASFFTRSHFCLTMERG